MSSPAVALPESIPYAQKRLGIEVSQVARLQRAVELLFRVAHSPRYLAAVDEGASPVVRHDPGSFGVFMGYDFHITPDGPRLIEINTNAGGALLNGLHSLMLCNREAADWLCCDPPPVEEAERRLIEMFRAEMAAAHGGNSSLEFVAIADERPTEQFLYPEFQMFVDLFERHGVRARICDTTELRAASDGSVQLDGQRVALVYLRDTDFHLKSPRTTILRDAYLRGAVVVTPSPREHHLLADKRRLALFADPAGLREFGLSDEDAAFLSEIVPAAIPLNDLSLDQAWSSRKEWVFKPFAAYGSKAVYRGDKISKGKLAEIYSQGGFLAQRRAEPGTLSVETSDGPREMKYDLRAYAYRDAILLLGARVYEGQVTNLRTPGGGFGAVCVAKDGTQSGCGG